MHTHTHTHTHIHTHVHMFTPSRLVYTLTHVYLYTCLIPTGLYTCLIPTGLYTCLLPIDLYICLLPIGFCTHVLMFTCTHVIPNWLVHMFTPNRLLYTRTHVYLYKCLLSIGLYTCLLPIDLHTCNTFTPNTLPQAYSQEPRSVQLEGVTRKRTRRSSRRTLAGKAQSPLDSPTAITNARTLALPAVSAASCLHLTTIDVWCHSRVYIVRARPRRSLYKFWAAHFDVGRAYCYPAWVVCPLS